MDRCFAGEKYARNIMKHLFLFCFGGFAYYVIEIAWRGYSSPSMYVVGGFLFVILGLMNAVIPWEMPILMQGILGAVIVTIVEFISGVVLNLSFGLDIWDYSSLPCNILGQICPLYSFLWIWCSIAAVVTDDWCRHLLFGEDRPHYRLY